MNFCKELGPQTPNLQESRVCPRTFLYQIMTTMCGAQEVQKRGALRLPATWGSERTSDLVRWSYPWILQQTLLFLQLDELCLGFTFGSVWFQGGKAPTSLPAGILLHSLFWYLMYFVALCFFLSKGGWEDLTGGVCLTPAPMLEQYFAARNSDVAIPRLGQGIRLSAPVWASSVLRQCLRGTVVCLEGECPVLCWLTSPEQKTSMLWLLSGRVKSVVVARLIDSEIARKLKGRRNWRMSIKEKHVRRPPIPDLQAEVIQKIVWWQYQ